MIDARPNLRLGLGEYVVTVSATLEEEWAAIEDGDPMRSIHGCLFALSVMAALSGCAATRQVRYVYQDRDFGVIGMPENSNRWPTHYRRQAEKLMTAHFPVGHEIVRAEEVVEGTRTLTVQGTNTAEVLPALPTALLSVGRLGRSSTRSQADRLKLKECRIVYRRVGQQTGPDIYAGLSTLTPTRYLDPNDAERHKLADTGENAKAGENEGEPPLDSRIKAASNHSAPPERDEPETLAKTPRKHKARPEGR